MNCNTCHDIHSQTIRVIIISVSKKLLVKRSLTIKTEQKLTRSEVKSKAIAK